MQAEEIATSLLRVSSSGNFGKHRNDCYTFPMVVVTAGLPLASLSLSLFTFLLIFLSFSFFFSFLCF